MVCNHEEPTNPIYDSDLDAAMERLFSLAWRYYPGDEHTCSVHVKKAAPLDLHYSEDVSSLSQEHVHESLIMSLRLVHCNIDQRPTDVVQTPHHLSAAGSLGCCTCSVSYSFCIFLAVISMLNRFCCIRVLKMLRRCAMSAAQEMQATVTRSSSVRGTRIIHI